MSNWLWLFCRSGFIFIMEEEFTCGIRIIAGFFLSLWLYWWQKWLIFSSPALNNFFPFLMRPMTRTIHYKINFENFDT